MVIYSITMDATDRVFCLVIYHLIFCMFTRPLGTKITKFPTLYFPYKSVDHCRKDNDIIWDLPLEISFNICSVGGITVPSINRLWSPVWRLSACLESGIIYNILFNMQNPSKILLKLKLGNSKVLQITS